MQGHAIGVVEQSTHPDFSIGDVVSSMNGWRDYFIATETEVDKIKKVDFPLPYYLSVLGMPGLTAYVGLLKLGEPKRGETVFVSAATGAVGSIVCQIAKLKGCHVIASAGSDAKIAWLKQTLHIDCAFNYKTCDDLNAALGELAPNGIDIYFDNVGGGQLEAAIAHMNLYGRIVMCGMISQYNAKVSAPGPRNLMQIIGKRLKLEGFIVSDYLQLKPDFYTDVKRWLTDDQMTVQYDKVKGLEQAPNAFIDLLSGQHLGKMLVEI